MLIGRQDSNKVLVNIGDCMTCTGTNQRTHSPTSSTLLIRECFTSGISNLWEIYLNKIEEIRDHRDLTTFFFLHCMHDHTRTVFLHSRDVWYATCLHNMASHWMSLHVTAANAMHHVAVRWHKWRKLICLNVHHTCAHCSWNGQMPAH